MREDETAVLIRECLEGNQESFAGLLKQYQRPVFNVAYRLLSNYEDARDVTQSVFLKVYEGLASFDSRLRFFSWIYRIAVNESINYLKSRRRHEDIEETIVEERSTPETLLHSTEVGQEIQKGLMSMAVEHRIVVVLKHFHHCSYRDIAEIVGIPEKTVKSRLFTARNQLREYLSGKGVL